MATRQKGRPPFLASPPALRTQRSVGFRSTPSTAANSTRRLAQALSSVTLQTKIQPLALVRSSTLLSAATIRPMEHLRFLTTYKVATTRPSVLVHSLTTLPAANNVALGSGAGASATTGSNNVYVGAGMQGVAGESDACYVKSIFGQTSATGFRSSLTQTTSWEPPCPQSALRKRSDRWTKRANHSWR